MIELPILFSGPMVLALLAGTKTQTRRIYKPRRCPYGMAGTKLWVRESFTYAKTDFSDRSVIFRADCDDPHVYKWKPSIFMRRADSRLTLEVTETRLQRLQDISEEDALAEGVEATRPQDTWSVFTDDGGQYTCFVEPTRGHGVRDFVKLSGGGETAVENYARLWGQINGVGSWSVNPLVWVVSFRTVAATRDQARREGGG